MRLLLTFLALILGIAATPGSAISVPPSPDRYLTGDAVICEPAFAVALAKKETAHRYESGLWVAQLAEGEVGIRNFTQAGRADRWQVLKIPGYRSATRQKVFEFPSHRARGWTYRLEIENTPPVSITADEFRGTKADYPLLRRVLLGKARASAC